MARVLVNSVNIYAGEAYPENTEDGPVNVFDHFAAVEAADGKVYRHLVPFRFRQDAGLLRLIARIEAKRVIETDHWVEFPPRLSLEERFDLYAQREHMVRHGFLAEED